MSDSERRIPVGDHQPVIRKAVGEPTERDVQVMRRVIGAAPVSRPAKTQEITELYSQGERKNAPITKPASVFSFSYEDNSPRLFDPLSIVLSVVVTSIIFALLWMMQ